MKIDGIVNKKEGSLVLEFNLNHLVKLSESNKMQVQINALCNKEPQVILPDKNCYLRKQ